MQSSGEASEEPARTKHGRKDTITISVTKFGQVSVERDKVYQEGKGDYLSKLLIQKQIDIFDAPRMRYDLGTVQLMLSEINATEWQGVRNFERGNILHYGLP